MTDDTTPSVTVYAAPTPSWEAWFTEYRFGALYVFPPEPLRSRVDALRSRYDPQAQAYCGAHISLTVPVPRPLTHGDIDEFTAVAKTLAPFTVAYGPPVAYPAVPGVVLRVEPAAEFIRLVERFEGCTAFAASRSRPYAFSPHMTLAEFITQERTEDILAELSPSEWSGTFRCGGVSYAVPDSAFCFTERLAWQFGG